jgi:trimeric autotransporter adhesin
MTLQSIRFAILLSWAAGVADAQTITTVVGSAWTFPASPLAAVRAPLGRTTAVTFDPAGNYYIADASNSMVFRVDTSGTLIIIAGNGTAGYSGDSGPGTSASLNSPQGVAVDAAGNVFIADTGNCRIREVSGGIITTVAGNGTAGYSGDNGPATSASLNSPEGLVVNAADHLYIADTFNGRIREVSAGIITTVAGNGGRSYSGDNGPATSASLYYPSGVTLDTSSDLFIADALNNRIRKVNTSGTITTVAGNGNPGYSGDNGPATSASLNNPSGVAVDATGNLYIADTNNARVRKVTTGGTISTIAGDGAQAFSGDTGPATSASLNYPDSVAVNASADLFIADTINSRIREVAAGIINTVAGDGDYRFSGDGGPAVNATLNSPEDVAVDASGNMYITDSANYRIRKVNTSGTITTVAGNGTAGYSGDNGPASSASLNSTYGIAVDTSGNLYIADSFNNRIRMVTAGGIISTVAGNGTASYSGDNGSATSASLNNPFGVAVDASGNLYIADTYNNRVRMVSTAGIITTMAGTGIGGYSGDNGPATNAELNYPYAVALDNSGNLYIDDVANYRIRKVSTDGTITTVVGTGVVGYSGNGGPATSATINSPFGIILDPAANLFIADSFNAVIRFVNSSGIISTIAGDTVRGFSGDNGTATSAELDFPSGVAVESTGNLLIADTVNNRIRQVTNVASPSLAVIGTPLPGATLSDNSADFSWAAVNGATEYQLTVGTTPGGANLFSGTLSGTSQTVNNIPCTDTGGAFYVQLATYKDGGWQPAVDYSYPCRLGFVDFNHDGHADIVWQDLSTGESQAWFLGGAQGISLLGSATFTPSNPWRIVGSADFNGDGAPDLVWQDPTTGATQVWFMGGAQGNQVIGAATIAASNPWTIVAVADFNRDGHPDIAWQDPVSGWVQIWYLGGPQGVTLQQAANITESNPWQVAGAADFNGDGVPDLLWQDPASGASQVWYMSGSLGNVVSSAASLSSPNTWRIAAVADFNLDGYQDVIWQDPGSGTSQVWFLTGAQGITIEGTAPLTGSNPWRIVSPR